MNDKKIPTISHDDIMAVDPNYGGIPPYDISEAAKGRTTAELYQDVIADRDFARANGGLLDHRSLTREMLWAESVGRDHRSAADNAAEPTTAEAKRLATAEATFLAADRRRKAAIDAIGAAEAGVRATVIMAAAETRVPPDALADGWMYRPDTKPAAVRQAEQILADARSEHEAADKAGGEALVRLNNVRANLAARQGIRRGEAQGRINATGFLANLRAFGGELAGEVRAAMKHHYGTDR